MQFQDVAVLPAQGGSHPAEYLWSDMHLQDQNYYQLFESDVNGKRMLLGAKYINGLRCNYGQNWVVGEVYPNPTRDVFRVIIESPEQERATQFVVRNLTGQLVFKAELDLIAGRNIVEYDLPQLPAGQYVLEIQSASGKRNVQKLMIQ